MQVVVPLRSGVVDLIYVVLFELVGLRLLLWIIDRITRHVAKRYANERGRLKLIGVRFTTFLGRGSLRSGLILKAVFCAVSLASILMVDLGTDGFTAEGAISKEVVYMGKTSDVDSQQRILGKIMKARESNYSIGYYEMWWDLLQACQETSPQTSTTFRSFCGTALCQEVFRESQHILTDDDDLEFSQGNQNPGHSDNFRCNDGRDAPEIILSKHPRTGSPRDGPATDVLFEYSEDDWEELFVERNLTVKMHVLQKTLVEESLEGWVLTCTLFEDVVMRRSCTVSFKIEESDVMQMGFTSSPEQYDEFTQYVIDGKVHLNSYTYAEFRHIDEELLSTNYKKWMITLNALALYHDVPVPEYLWHVNSELKLGLNPAEIEENLKTEISTVAVVGAIILGSAIVIAAFGLLVIAELDRRKTYLDLNLGLDDHELYSLMRNGLGDDRESEKQAVRPEHIYIGFSTDQGCWGILRDNDPSIRGDLGLKELRRRQVANDVVDDPT